MEMRAVLALVLMFSTGCASMQKSEMFAAGCAGLDIATTAYALDNGATEMNPLAVDGYEVASLVVFSAAAHWGLGKALDRVYATKGKKAPW
jgi:hypothetical protein